MSIKIVCLIESIWLKVWVFLTVNGFARFYWNVWERAAFDSLKGGCMEEGCMTSLIKVFYGKIIDWNKKKKSAAVANTDPHLTFSHSAAKTLKPDTLHSLMLSASHKQSPYAMLERSHTLSWDTEWPGRSLTYIEAHWCSSWPVPQDSTTSKINYVFCQYQKTVISSYPYPWWQMAVR